MKFKESDDAKWYIDPTFPAEFEKRMKRPLDVQAFEKLKWWVKWLDDMSRQTGNGELVITSFWRPDNDKESYHKYGQAIDIRIITNHPAGGGKTKAWQKAVAKIFDGIDDLDTTVQLCTHPELVGTPDEHYHLEIDTNSIVKTGNH